MKSHQHRGTFQVVRKSIPEHKYNQKLSVTSKLGSWQSSKSKF